MASIGFDGRSQRSTSSLAASCSRAGLRCWLRCLWRDGLLGRHDLRLITVSMRYASAYVAQHSPCLYIPRPPVVPPTFGIGRSRAIPGIECVSVVLAHLLFGGQTLTELVEYQIGTDRRNAAYKDHKHPFHASHLPSCQPNGTVRIGLAPAFLPVTRRTVVASPSHLPTTAPTIVAMGMTSSPTMTMPVAVAALHLD